MQHNSGNSFTASNHLPMQGHAYQNSSTRGWDGMGWYGLGWVVMGWALTGFSGTVQ